MVNIAGESSRDLWTAHVCERYIILSKVQNTGWLMITLDQLGDDIIQRRNMYIYIYIYTWYILRNITIHKSLKGRQRFLNTAHLPGTWLSFFMLLGQGPTAPLLWYPDERHFTDFSWDLLVPHSRLSFFSGLSTMYDDYNNLVRCFSHKSTNIEGTYLVYHLVI